MSFENHCDIHSEKVLPCDTIGPALGSPTFARFRYASPGLRRAGAKPPTSFISSRSVVHSTVGESPSGKAVASGATIRGFESLLPSQHGHATVLALGAIFCRGVPSGSDANTPQIPHISRKPMTQKRSRNWRLLFPSEPSLSSLLNACAAFL